MREDLSLELLQGGARLDPQLVDKCPSAVGVNGERVCLATRPVQGEHQLAAKPLAERLGRDDALKLGQQLAVVAKLELCLEPLLKRHVTEGLEAGQFGSSDAGVAQLGQRRSPPQRKRVAQQLRRLIRWHRSCLRKQRLEPIDVQLPRLDSQQIARRTRLQPALTEHPSQPGDESLHQLGRGCGWPLTPKRLDQEVRRHDLVRVQEKRQQQRPLPSAAERKRPLFVEQLERSKHPELHSRQSVNPAVAAA